MFTRVTPGGQLTNFSLFTTDAITDYIKFCMATTIPVKTVRKYPNSRPWMTHQIKLKLREKQQAFQRKDWLSLRDINCSVKKEIQKAKLAYKDKLEQDFSSMNTRQAFQKVKTLTGTTSKASTPAPIDPNAFTRNLNNFYARFDNMNFTTECERLLGSLPTPEQPNLVFPTVEDVHQHLRRCKTGKAPGPDGITGRLLKNYRHRGLVVCDTAYFGIDPIPKSVTAYQQSIAHFTQWCRDSHLLLNVTKTKELILDTRRKLSTPHCPISINNQPVEIVDRFRYLGITIDQGSATRGSGAACGSLAQP
ncbi:hypothetical protein N1851_017299 [Merluccius polli]|uniref:Reverse transcriptase n=1 Tax=Merluccius polli TaxID=89951 RepID=A0AA47NZ60_MERPO|nr:hypothetical protein N1851_017299 [Merluccius polli]